MSTVGIVPCTNDLLRRKLTSTRLPEVGSIRRVLGAGPNFFVVSRRDGRGRRRSGGVVEDGAVDEGDTEVSDE